MSDVARPTTQEEEYFAREEIEKKRKLAFKQHSEIEALERDARKKLHYLKCPKCGMDLHTLNQGSVEVDTCFNCNGVWLDAGELEQLLKGKDEAHSGTVMRAVMRIFSKNV